MQKITPFLWFDMNAQEAVNFYTSIFKKAKITSVTYYGKEGFEIHHMEEGTAMTIGFVIEDQQFTAINGGPVFKFNEAVSFVVNCKNQKEIDYYWDRLSKGGDPKAQQCGWLKDKFGVSWQIIPENMGKLVSTPEGMREMLQMKKIDVKKLQEAPKKSKQIITVKTAVQADAKKVWEYWIEPKHIKNWYHATDDWYVPDAKNNVFKGGKFKITMSSKDKKSSFDFEGIYTKIKPFEIIQYKIGDGRNVAVTFIDNGNSTTVMETFETENVYSLEQQRSGWQGILDNFKKYVEAGI